MLKFLYLLQHHPDINKSHKAHGEYLKIQEAYKVLSKAESRAIYDLGLPNSVPDNEPYHTVSNNWEYKEATKHQSRK